MSEMIKSSEIVTVSILQVFYNNELKLVVGGPSWSCHGILLLPLKIKVKPLSVAHDLELFIKT